MLPDIRESPIGMGPLRLSPALITLVLVINRVAQYYAFTSFLPPHMPPLRHEKRHHDAAPTFQLWFRVLAARIWVPVVVLSELQMVLCALNLLWAPPTGPTAWWLHLFSLVLANGHWPFVPRLLRAERAVKDVRATPAQSLAALRDWMDVNNVRVLLVDVPQAFVTAAAALASATWE
ncbi:hypothetical protein DL771_004508 [Monosporascus sp. 5C6A]|nr:hypothetical protein DL771_004508 [Monosporascus sp. 5C6A]